MAMISVGKWKRVIIITLIIIIGLSFASVGFSDDMNLPTISNAIKLQRENHSDPKKATHQKLTSLPASIFSEHNYAYFDHLKSMPTEDLQTFINEWDQNYSKFVLGPR